MAGASVGVAATGRLMPDILARLNISRCALCGQAEHLKMWRSIPHTVAVSVCTCIRRIAAPHATHFITPPELRVHMEPIGRRLSSGRRGLRRGVAAGPRMATKACGTCAHSDKMNAFVEAPTARGIPLLRHPGLCEIPLASPRPCNFRWPRPRPAGRSMSFRNRPVAPFTAQPDDGMMTLLGPRVSSRQATNEMSVCCRRV